MLAYVIAAMPREERSERPLGGQAPQPEREVLRGGRIA